MYLTRVASIRRSWLFHRNMDTVEEKCASRSTNKCTNRNILQKIMELWTGSNVFTDLPHHNNNSFLRLLVHFSGIFGIQYCEMFIVCVSILLSRNIAAAVTVAHGIMICVMLVLDDCNTRIQR